MSVVIAHVERLIRGLRRELGALIRRGELSLASAAGYVQLAGFEGEQFDDTPLWQQYGLASRPPAGTEVLTVHLGGRSEEAIAFATDSHDHRPGDLAADEVVTYGKSGASGQAQVRHQPDGTLRLACATGKFVEVGGATEKLMMGESLKSALDTWAGSVKVVLSAPVGPYDITLANSILSAQLTSALATKGKVA